MLQFLRLSGLVRYEGHVETADRDFSKRVRAVWRGGAISSHAYWSEQLVQNFLEPCDFVRLFMIRDLRDIAVSNYHYILKSRGHRLHRYFKELLSNEARLTASIQGISSSELHGEPESLSIGQHADGFSGWLDDDKCLVIRFEDLIGSRGGGSDEIQRSVVNRLLDHMGAAKHEKRVHHICENLFGRQSHTFRKGRIGAWRSEFNDDHVELFKRTAGDVLIRYQYEQDWNWHR